MGVRSRALLTGCGGEPNVCLCHVIQGDVDRGRGWGVLWRGIGFHCKTYF